MLRNSVPKYVIVSVIDIGHAIACSYYVCSIVEMVKIVQLSYLTRYSKWILFPIDENIKFYILLSVPRDFVIQYG